MVNLQELEIFLAAAQQENFSEAGRYLHLSQPAVSQAIQKLEQHFGTQLFLRNGRAVHLSAAGSLLMHMAQELMANATRLEETMTSMQNAVAGKFKIACSTASGKYLLPHLIAEFRKLYPQVRIDVLVGGRNYMIQRVIEGEYSFGISSKRIDHANLDYMRFYTDHVVLIVSPTHPWANFRRIMPDDILDTPLILREDGSGTSEVLFQGLRAKDITPEMLNVAMVLGNTEAIELAVEENIGAAFVSRLAAQRCINQGRLIEVSVEGLNLQHDLYIARSRRFPAERAQIEFWQYLKNQIPELENRDTPVQS